MVAAGAVGDVQMFAGQELVKETGAPCVLAGGFVSDPRLDLGRRYGSKWARERFEVDAFMLECKAEMTGRRGLGSQGFVNRALLCCAGADDASCGSHGGLHAQGLADLEAVAVDGSASRAEFRGRQPAGTSKS